MSADRQGEMCILHRTVFSRPTGKETRFVMVSCRPSCPKHTPGRR